MTIAPEVGTISAAAAPCSARAAMIHASPSPPAGASPHSAEATKNPATPILNVRTPPTRSPSLPPKATRAVSAST